MGMWPNMAYITRGAPQNLGVPLQYLHNGSSATSYFKFGTQLEFAKAYHKITPIGKVAWP